MSKSEHRHYLRQYVDDYKQNKKCKHCTENTPICLEFHHRDPESKVDTIPSLIKRGCSLRELKREINKCDLLCSNCHKKEHFRLKELANATE